ncbi:hypothetical protein [Hymenobacter canadensis]|uniref:Uncharacterized protein n=1 Tax=Hymenobacter canadensis TaxID=2999067 RepID=A0ABY7LSZ0_9BACT|nr:hypothetical protein [Hymenobacter canadensis]WBA43520.1 hypothetical protein O3303_08105 [Hymenobacter canadensis]
MKFPLPPLKSSFLRSVFAQKPPAFLSLNGACRGCFGDAVREAVASSAAVANCPARRRAWQQILRFARLPARHFFRHLPHILHHSSQSEHLYYFLFKILKTNALTHNTKSQHRTVKALITKYNLEV